ncbi:MAG: hypothetical protein CMH27_02575 [Micavibrio sp.]|nr:hypothetical protein [Micavibrio sp.]
MTTRADEELTELKLALTHIFDAGSYQSRNAVAGEELESNKPVLEWTKITAPGSPASEVWLRDVLIAEIHQRGLPENDAKLHIENFIQYLYQDPQYEAYLDFILSPIYKRSDMEVDLVWEELNKYLATELSPEQQKQGHFSSEPTTLFDTWQP